MLHYCPPSIPPVHLQYCSYQFITTYIYVFLTYFILSPTSVVYMHQWIGHYLNQCWVILNWTLKSKLQWILTRNSKLLNAFENIVSEMAAILSRAEMCKQIKLKDRVRYCCSSLFKVKCTFCPFIWNVFCYQFINWHFFPLSYSFY